MFGVPCTIHEYVCVVAATLTLLIVLLLKQQECQLCTIIENWISTCSDACLQKT